MKIYKYIITITIAIGSLVAIHILNIEQFVVILGGNVILGTPSSKDGASEKLISPDTISTVVANKGLEEKKSVDTLVNNTDIKDKSDWQLNSGKIIVDEVIQTASKIPLLITSAFRSNSAPTKSISSDKISTNTIIINVPEDKNSTAKVVSEKQDKMTPETANTKSTDSVAVLENGIPSIGYLIAKSDKKLYLFMLNHSSIVNIAFTPSAGDNASYKLTIQDAFGSVLTQKDIDDETTSLKTGNLYLRAGKYKVKVERLYSWSGKPFNITLKTSQAVNTEEEINDTIQTANLIPINEDIRASTGTRNDIDCFAFTLDKTSSVCPNLEFKPVRNGRDIYDRKLYELVIYGIDKEPFTFRGDNKPSKTIRPFILEAGTYITKLSRIEDMKKLELGLHEYTLRVSAQEIM